MDWLSTLAGIVLVLLGLAEVFRTLLHPTGRGRFSTLFLRLVWSVARLFGGWGRSLAGPLGAVAVILFWAALQVFGWALIYLPHIPQGFTSSDGVSASMYGQFYEAVYFSMISLSTLGLGDLTPTDAWVRILTPVQALVGFGLLTAAVSWFMQLYPALGRRRALATQLSTLDGSGFASSMRANPDGSARVLDTLSSALAQVTVDLVQNQASYFFSDESRSASLPVMLPSGLRLARIAADSRKKALTSSGRSLEVAIDDFADTLRRRFAIEATVTDAVLREYSRTHSPR